MKVYIKVFLVILFATAVISYDYYYLNYLKLYSFTINEKTFQTTLNKFDDVKEMEIAAYTKLIISTSRASVSKSNKDVVSNIESFEEVVFSEEGNKIKIEVIHRVPFYQKKVIEYEKETIKDDSKYSDYKEIIQEGKNGYEETSFTRLYVNGVEEDTLDIKNKTVVAVNEITSIGTKERPTYTPQNSGGISNGSSNWNSVASSSTSNINSSSCQVNDLSCGTWRSHGLESGLCTRSAAGSWDCPLYWVEY